MQLLIEHPKEERSHLAVALAVEGGLAILALLLAWIFRVPILSQLAPAGAPLGKSILVGALATLPLLAMFWWLIHATWPEARRLREQVEQLINDLFPRASLFELAMISVVAGVSEELLFRGVAQPLIGRWTTPVVGLVIASVGFGLCHAISWLYFALATLVGVYFGLLVVTFGDLVSPIVAHSLYDFLALAYLARQIRNRNVVNREVAAANNSETASDKSCD